MAKNTLGIDLPNVSSSAMQTVNPDQAFQGDQGASKLFGQLSRAQWEDWKARFSPYIQSLADAAMDPMAAQNAAQSAYDSYETAAGNAQQGLAMQRQGLGINLTPAQQQAEERRQQGSQQAGAVSSANQARISALDRQQQILGGGLGLSNIPDQVLNQ